MFALPCGASAQNVILVGAADEALARSGQVHAPSVPKLLHSRIAMPIMRRVARPLARCGARRDGVSASQKGLCAPIADLVVLW
jgi:hypothetical protein